MIESLETDTRKSSHWFMDGGRGASVQRKFFSYILFKSFALFCECVTLPNKHTHTDKTILTQIKTFQKKEVNIFDSDIHQTFELSSTPCNEIVKLPTEKHYSGVLVF